MTTWFSNSTAPWFRQAVRLLAEAGYLCLGLSDTSAMFCALCFLRSCFPELLQAGGMYFTSLQLQHSNYKYVHSSVPVCCCLFMSNYWEGLRNIASQYVARTAQSFGNLLQISVNFPELFCCSLRLHSPTGSSQAFCCLPAMAQVDESILMASF